MSGWEPGDGPTDGSGGVDSPFGPDGHADEHLSAYVDRQLDPEQRRAVDDHLATCSSCRSDLEAVVAIRTFLRALPMVEPPHGFYDRLLLGGLAALQAPPRRRDHARWKRFGVANLVATAAAWLIVLGVANIQPAGGSTVAAGDVIRQSAALLPVGRVTTHATEQDHEEAHAHGVPSNLDGTYELTGFSVVEGIPRAVYSNGERVLSVFVVPGRLTWGSMAEPQPVRVNGAPAWRLQAGGADMILVQRPGCVVVIAGPPSVTSPDLAGQVSSELPDDDSFMARLEGAGRSLLETFGLRG